MVKLNKKNKTYHESVEMGKSARTRSQLTVIVERTGWEKNAAGMHWREMHLNLGKLPFFVL